MGTIPKSIALPAVAADTLYRKASVSAAKRYDRRGAVAKPRVSAPTADGGPPEVT
jgi:hypothetical protein